MREIKFRAWDGERMEYTDTPHYKTAGYWGVVVFENPTNQKLMQYTGLKDKNGKEIYEGDIVRVYDVERGCVCNDWEDCEAPEAEDIDCAEHGKHTHESPSDCDNYLCLQEVKWACGYFCDEDTGDFCPPLANEEIYMEIIGNIYENPDLLTLKQTK